MTEPSVVPAILCGGSGTRLWPASRENRPKQFLNLIDERSLLQNTVLRALRISGAAPEALMTVTLAALADGVRDQLAGVNAKTARHVIPEPCARNTAAAVALAALHAARIGGEDALVWILPADHHIGDEAALAEAFVHAKKSAMAGNLVTFGIQPTRPDTGYGYIRVGAADNDNIVRKADKFVEKPDLDTARAYLADGNYLWNSGMFLFSAKTVLNHYRTHAPGILNGVEAFLSTGDPALYGVIEEKPFDKAIMEKSANVAVVPCDPAWSDIGSWESLWDIRSKDENGNAVEGPTVLSHTRNCLVHAGGGRLVGCAGVENIVVIDTGDAILIADRSNADAMRGLVKDLRKNNRESV